MGQFKTMSEFEAVQNEAALNETNYKGKDGTTIKSEIKQRKLVVELNGTKVILDMDAVKALDSALDQYLKIF